MRLLDDVIGKEILDCNANILGKVKDLEIDAASKKIEFIITTKAGKSKKILISNEEEKIPFEMVSRVGDKIILQEDLEDLINY